MKILTPEETLFLDAFLHEVTTPPFTGSLTKALHKIGVEYGDISYIAWVYNRDVPRASFEWGNSAEVAPPLPWPTREAALRRNLEIHAIREHDRKPTGSPNGSG